MSCPNKCISLGRAKGKITDKDAGMVLHFDMGATDVGTWKRLLSRKLEGAQLNDKPQGPRAPVPHF